MAWTPLPSRTSSTGTAAALPPAAAVGVGDEIEELFGGAPAAAPEAGAEGVESAPQPQGGEDDDDDDLEMFRAWLQSLKR